MADVWKSNPRHFCTFCKCWIADNKPSKDFHEQGKRHKENVKKRIDEMQKKSKEKAEAESDFDKTMKMIERKAKAAFKKDIASNPMLKAAYEEKLKQKEALDAANAPVHGCELPPPNMPQPPKEKPQSRPKVAAADVSVEPSSSDDAAVCKWIIAFSDEGYPYFWNTETNEVQWTKPADYVPPHGAAQPGVPGPPGPDTAPAGAWGAEEGAEEEASTAGGQEEGETVPHDQQGGGEPPVIQEINFPMPNCTADIPLPPPKMEPPKENPPLPPKVDSPKPEETLSETTEVEEPIVQKMGAKLPSAKAYGQWESIPEPVIEPPEDLQLPEVEKTVEEKTITIVEPKFKIRTKTVNPIAEGLVAFKKRKLAQGTKNIKKREDDR